MGEDALARTVVVHLQDGGAAGIAFHAHIAARSRCRVEFAVGKQKSAGHVPAAARRQICDVLRVGGAQAGFVPVIAHDFPDFGDIEPAVVESDAVGAVEVPEDGHHPFCLAAVVRIGQRQHGAFVGSSDHQHATWAEGQHARRLLRVREDADVKSRRQVEFASVHLGGGGCRQEQKDQQTGLAHGELDARRRELESGSTRQPVVRRRLLPLSKLLAPSISYHSGAHAGGHTSLKPKDLAAKTGVGSLALRLITKVRARLAPSSPRRGVQFRR